MSNSIRTAVPSQADKPEAASIPRPMSRAQQLNRLYSLPAPLRTFPLPTFVPHNPISLFHVLYVWVSQTINPQSSHLDPLYQAWFSPDTRSVHVTDSRSIRGLWEQGFYGKGNLSRSEPAWLDGEKKRRGDKGKTTSEEVTRKRRSERQETKWERARKEREAIDQRLLEEAEAAVRQNSRINADFLGKSIIALVDEDERIHTEDDRKNTPPNGPLELMALPNSQMDVKSKNNDDTFTYLDQHSPRPHSSLSYTPPVGPLELLALPNSNMHAATKKHEEDFLYCKNLKRSPKSLVFVPPVGPLELLALPNSISTIVPIACSKEPEEVIREHAHTNGRTSYPMTGELRSVHGHAKTVDIEGPLESVDSEETTDVSTPSNHVPETNGSALANGRPTTPNMKRQKSVRFSPTVEKNMFIQSEPPSPGNASAQAVTLVKEPVDESVEEPVAIKEQEHLQVTLEEAFFLCYALGALAVFNSESKCQIPIKDLFYQFRKSSYFPPRANSSLSPDDPFMVNYVVYHHFRSLGWVVRPGIKFSCDYMLYMRGPVFSHAEFGVVILPSYSDPYWKSNAFLENYVKGKETRTWAWMSCINRVIAQVKKTMVLCYVDIPRPLEAAEEDKLGVDGILARYKVREVIMKRFVANRMRD